VVQQAAEQLDCEFLDYPLTKSVAHRGLDQGSSDRGQRTSALLRAVGEVVQDVVLEDGYQKAVLRMVRESSDQAAVVHESVRVRSGLPRYCERRTLRARSC